MDTSFAKNFGAVELVDTLPTLARSKHACDRVMEAVGDERGEAALEMMKGARLEGDLGAEIHDFLVDEIRNEAQAVWSGLTYEPEDEDNVDQQFPISIMQYEGIYFVWALEYDPQGYFLNRKDAHSYVHRNWLNIKPDLS